MANARQTNIPDTAPGSDSIARLCNRRQALSGLALATACLASGCVTPHASDKDRLQASLRLIEANGNGTLGVALYDTRSGQTFSYKGYARFPLCSTFKLTLAALTLYRIQQGTVAGDDRLHWTKADLLAYSPFTAQHLQEGATLLELAEYAQKASDNTAANLLLAQLGGPQAITQFWRMLGDETSRLDRIEPQLNQVPVGEILDTTTPDAMVQTVARLLYGDILSAPNRALLRDWMITTRTGVQRVRAGVPQTWVAGDKTGTSLWPGMRSVYADIGFMEPPDAPPLTFATYFRTSTRQNRIDPAANAVLADVGRLAARLTERNI